MAPTSALPSTLLPSGSSIDTSMAPTRPNSQPRWRGPRTTRRPVEKSTSVAVAARASASLAGSRGTTWTTVSGPGRRGDASVPDLQLEGDRDGL